MSSVTVKDWYAWLGVAPSATPADIAAKAEVKSRQAAAMANTAPERSQQMREDVRALKRDLLTSTEARRQYDERLRGASAPAAPAAPQVDVPRVAPPAQVPPVVAPGGQTSAPGWSGEPRRPRGNRFLQFLQTGWTCQACGEGALPSDKFCPRCGAEIVAPTAAQRPEVAAVPGACRRCGVALAAGSRFCTGCGTAVG